MGLQYRCLVLVSTLWLGACGGVETGPSDPGRPTVVYGPRCSVMLSTAPPQSLEQCTAIATISEGAAHLYLELYPDREPTGVKRYASIVLMASDWRPGQFKEAVGGRIEIAFTDGRRYLLAPEGGRTFPIGLDISSAVRAETGDHYYLRGDLTATLPAVAGAQEQIGLKVAIN
jgi:hypothetical protein